MTATAEAVIAFMLSSEVELDHKTQDELSAVKNPGYAPGVIDIVREDPRFEEAQKGDNKTRFHAKWPAVSRIATGVSGEPEADKVLGTYVRDVLNRYGIAPPNSLTD
jgi:hypothetical protein